MWTVWWVWIAGGFALGVAEVLLPGFIFLGFAAGAVLTGVLLGIGLSVSLPLTLADLRAAVAGVMDRPARHDWREKGAGQTVGQRHQ